MERSFLNKDIICAPMTRVSDADLAIAIDKAGGIGSISSAGFSNSWLKKELSKFTKERKHNNVVVSLSDNIREPECQNIIKIFKPKYVVLLDEETKTDKYIRNSLLNLGIRVIIRINTLSGVNIFPPPDYYTIKGKDSAGRFNKDLPILDLLKLFKDKYPDFPVICTGGLYTKEAIQECFNHGASAIEVGTPFAISEESNIDIKTKMSIITKPSVKIMDNSGYERRVHSPNSQYNLGEGVSGNLDAGHVYIGSKINELPRKIRFVQEIMNDLLPIG